MPGTIYPVGIDGFSQLPLVQDNVSPVRAADINRIRDAIVAVETELGINPSGTFGTVRARLDALDGLINSIGDGYGASILTDRISGLIESPSNKSYTLDQSIPFDGFIDTVFTEAVSGTATATVDIEGVPLGGTANAVSSTEVMEAHTSDNTFVIGDKISLTISANSGSTDVAFTIVYVRTP